MGSRRPASAPSSGAQGRSGLPKQNSRPGTHPAPPGGARTKVLRASKIPLQTTSGSPLQVTPVLKRQLAALLGRILANDVLQLPELPGADTSQTTSTKTTARLRRTT